MPSDRYDAFISYSHEHASIAARLSRRIRTYRPPRATGLSRRRLRVFRDRERLTTSADLAAALAETVGASEHLVLLASPAAAHSPYVDQEVAAFLARQPESKISIVVCAGELPDNLPPALRARMREPLYIDLRAGRRRTFRLESLRLIAALLGVAYADLRREDEARRFRRRLLAAAATVILGVTAASAYVISTTPAEAWSLVAQPAVAAGPDPLMPVERIAVRVRDGAVAWLADNARYRRDLANVRESWAPIDADRFGFDQRAMRSLKASTDVETVRPVAHVAIAARRGGRPIGSGTLRVYAFLDRGRLRFARTFHFAPVDASTQPALALPLTIVDDGREPFDLEPWPADALRQAGYDTGVMTIGGLLRDLTIETEAIPVQFAVSDNRADIREVLAATAGPEHIVLSTAEDAAVALRDRLESDGSDELWTALQQDPAWSVHRPPTRAKARSFARESSSFEADARGAGLEPGVIAAIDPDRVAGDLFTLEQIERGDGDPAVAVATLTGVWDHHEKVGTTTPIHALRIGREDTWKPLMLPFEMPSTRIFDVARGGDPRTIWLVSDREGLFRSTDAGASWHGASFGESRLRSGERVRIIAAGASLFALAAIHGEPGDDPNPLFRLEQRSWWRRWRFDDRPDGGRVDIPAGDRTDGDRSRRLERIVLDDDRGPRLAGVVGPAGNRPDLAAFHFSSVRPGQSEIASTNA